MVIEQAAAPGGPGGVLCELSTSNHKGAPSLYDGSRIGVPRHAATKLLHKCLRACIRAHRACPQLSEPQGWLWSHERCQVSHWLGTVYGSADLQRQKHACEAPTRSADNVALPLNSTGQACTSKCISRVSALADVGLASAPCSCCIDFLMGLTRST